MNRPIAPWNNLWRCAAAAGLFRLLIGVSPAAGYEEITVTDGGALTGRVVLNGPPPPARIFHLIFSPNIDFCAKISDGKGNRLLKEFQTSADGGLQHAVVAVVGVARGKAFDYAPKLQIDTCRIAPFVMPVRNRRPLAIVNHDPIAHDIQGYTLKDNYTFAMFNKQIVPESEAAREIRFRPNHYIFRTQCGVHDFMQSWGLAVGNPYFAVTGPDGRFRIEDLPPGDYDVIAWHPHMNVQAGRITIPPGGTASVDFAFDAADADIPLHDLQTGYRLETALQPRHLAAPPVELQTP
ncbi:MAG: carboxypeptidase-like regulatory domain-containing protein [Nitrospirota bacterium]